MINLLARLLTQILNFKTQGFSVSIKQSALVISLTSGLNNINTGAVVQQ